MLDFLAELVEAELSYSAINSARSALSAIGLVKDGCSVGTHPLVIRFLKGVYNMRPPQSRYVETWDVSVVLRYLKTLYPEDTLSLKMLTFKLVMLIALVLAARCQTIHLLTIEGMRKESSKYVLRFSGPLKQSRPGVNVPFAELRAFRLDKALCVYNSLTVYLSKTANIRNKTEKLFVSFVKPHNSVSSATIGRWIKTVMCNAGIDCSKYGAHSVRSASSSKAKNCRVPIQEILKTAGWSSARTFSQFYDKRVVTNHYDDILTVTE